MTLSFITRWRDELPATYTALSPTPLNNARLIWHNTELANTLSIPSSLFKMAQVSGAAKPYCTVCHHWRRFTVVISSASGRANWVMGAAFYLANNCLLMALQWTGI